MQGPLDKIHEEATELEKEVRLQSDRIEEEAGDLLFSVVNLYRKLGLDAEETLRLANKKFMSRFEKMTALAENKALVFSDLSIDQQEVLWSEVNRPRYKKTQKKHPISGSKPENRGVFFYFVWPV